MGLETGNYIGDLNPANPPGTDPQSQGDDHLRLIKKGLLNSFPTLDGALLCHGTDGGVVNAYTVTPPTALLAYSTKLLILFVPVVDCNGASTMNISGLGAKVIKRTDGGDTVALDLRAGVPTWGTYDGTNVRLLGVTKNYVDSLAFNSALPAQAGHARELLSTDGTNAGFSPSLYASVLRWVDGTDISKKLAFNLSSVTTATTRTVTFGDRDVDLGMGYFKVSEQYASGTSGGATVATTITQKRLFNTSTTTTIPGASLATNQVTLPAGRYRVKGRNPGFAVNGHQAFLYNVTAAAYTLIGTSMLAGGGASNGYSDSVISGEFTIAVPSVFEVRWYTAAVSAQGYGLAVNSGQPEVYAELEFWKIG